MTGPSSQVYDALFRPRSIAIVGGSESLSKPGGTVLANIVDHGYKGTLRVVNPGGTPVKGLPTFSSVNELPEVPELAIIAIPARLVADALEDLGRKGTKAAIILSAGFGEKGEEGKREELRLAAIADELGMTIIGPNCSGFMTPHYSGKFAGIIPELKPRSIDFISGSGATVDLVMEQAVLRGLAFCNVVNVGNSVQTGVEDLIKLYDENYGEEGSPILLVYIESLRKPAMFFQHARSLTQKGCTIVGVKSGVAAFGARAAASHTGAMANDDTVVQAIFDKAGIIRVRSKMEMIDVACALMAAGRRLAGSRACVITDAGGPGVMATDELERHGLAIPVLGEKTRERLRTILPAEASVMNPIDCLPSRTGDQLRAIFEVLGEEEKGAIDVIAIQAANPGMMHPNEEIYRAIGHAMHHSPIPFVTALSSVTTCTELIAAEFTGRGHSYFPDEVNMGWALGRVLNRKPLFAEARHPDHYDAAAIAEVIADRKGALPSDVVTQVLAMAGFSFPPEAIARRADDVRAACLKTGFPVAMKVLGPLHKSDAGGVWLGITDDETALQTWHELMRIEGAEGVMVQRMVEGTEVIIGAAPAGDVGHLVMFGLGGIYTEVLRDVAFTLAPAAIDECRAMVRSVRAYPIIQGIRGQTGISVDLLADAIMRLSWLVADLPAISEIDINPLKGTGDELYVVDARIII